MGKESAATEKMKLVGLWLCVAQASAINNATEQQLGLQSLIAIPSSPGAPKAPLTPSLKAAGQMAIWHTDMMALYYVFAFGLGYYKLAVETGGWIVDKETAYALSAPNLEKTLPSWMTSVVKSQPFPWVNYLKLERKEFHEMGAPRSRKLPKDGKDVGAFLQLSAERRREKDLTVVLTLWSIWWDVLANFHIVMSCIYSIPQAIVDLKTPSYKAFITFWRIVAFYWWAAVQWWVDLVHINGGKVAFIKYIDAGALRLKDWAFTLLGLEAFAIMYSLGAPTKANLVSYLSVADTLKLVELAKACIWIGYIAEAGIKAGEGLSKMVPALGMQFAYTAFHSDFIARMSA